MKVLGIDPGLAQVGYGVVNTADPMTLLACGVIRTRPGPSPGERMVEIARDLRRLVRQHRPRIAAVEKFFFYRSSNTIAVVQARGVVLMTMARLRVPTLEYAPTQVKRTLTGDGRADKDQVLNAVMRALCLEHPPQPDDAADAIAVALTAKFHQFHDDSQQG
ncbi:crossover junction endodeoxyribonuclease RuvC [Candidatus Synechococcus spongiarum]|uniref:Crossover junction endodeoxyribonuclease RuvC n=1 Tax=Candidatus Synechococcus spongiarum LMB bulk15N TaxID=1943583 RepID=A0A1T1D556_9SYNE|nr:crossover junction endodeoxyribonuclease RuvC [Candidatus Synechococcus spongiarum]MCY4359879.1 crossover junction endodeoxyribonuclease RuvC [Cyanobacteria bacterium MAG APA_bin_95]OOV35971.1 crossover junction endodeoxyribonuclease RuvC [Candidatus Synechococcus spongiarum LMB bulk15N]